MISNHEDVQDLHASIGAYYGQRVQKFGPTPLGVDWTCKPTQELRFVQLLKICDWSKPFCLNDLGCGYGALRSFLNRRHRSCRVDYLGTDLSSEMVQTARAKWKRNQEARFEVGSQSSRTADYSIASGIFNVKLMAVENLWDGFIRTSLQALYASSRVGFSVNFLSPRSGGNEGPAELYFADPGQWIAYCRLRFDANVDLLEGYGLREFTLLVRKSAPSLHID